MSEHNTERIFKEPKAEHLRALKAQDVEALQSGIKGGLWIGAGQQLIEDGVRDINVGPDPAALFPYAQRKTAERTSVCTRFP